MPTRALILRAVDRHIARADQRILVRLIALGMIGRGLIDLGLMGAPGHRPCIDRMTVRKWAGKR